MGRTFRKEPEFDSIRKEVTTFFVRADDLACCRCRDLLEIFGKPLRLVFIDDGIWGIRGGG